MRLQTWSSTKRKTRTGSCFPEIALFNAVVLALRWLGEVARKRAQERSMMATGAAPFRSDRAGRQPRRSGVAGFGGKNEVETCPARAVVGGPQAAVVGFHDGPADGQTHAGAMGFRGEEGAEDLIRVLG